MNTPVVAELLRGICVEATSVRVGRNLQKTDATPVSHGGPEACAPEESALGRGYDAGWQQGREEGRHSGHEEGLRKGMEEALSRSRAATERAITEARASLVKQEERLRVWVDTLDAAMPHCLATIEDELVALCYEAVCHVFGSTALSPQVVRSHLQHLLSQWPATPAVELHVHPQDAEMLAAAGAAQDAGTWRWVADPEIALGGCVLVERGGGLDARLETALEGCKAALLAQRSRRRGVGGETP